MSPTFSEIGKLAAIAAIRTVLKYFLAQEIECARQAVDHGGASTAERAGLHRHRPEPARG